MTETVFENRFRHVEALQRMKASIKADGRTAIVRGKAKLQGARVAATDLRAGAALILAALAAEGESIITGLHHLDRGYVDLEGKLRALGADIWRVPSEETVSDASEAADAEVPLFAVKPSLATL